MIRTIALSIVSAITGIVLAQTASSTPPEPTAGPACVGCWQGLR